MVCSAYQEYGADLRILSSDPLQTECPKIVYLVRSQLSLMKLIASQIRNDESKGFQREYFLYFVPRRIVACEKVPLVLFFYVWTIHLWFFILICAGGPVCWDLRIVSKAYYFLVNLYLNLVRMKTQSQLNCQIWFICLVCIRVDIAESC